MANQAFTLLNSVNISNSGITANGAFTVYTSDIISNNNNIQSLRVIINYTTPNPSTINITAVAESQQNGQWFPIAYQYNPFTDMDNGPQRIILLQPNVSVFDAGIDDDMYVGNTVIARISRQQGKVGSSFRVRFVVYENNYGTAGAFQNVNVSAYGELFD